MIERTRTLNVSFSGARVSVSILANTFDIDLGDRLLTLQLAMFTMRVQLSGSSAAHSHGSVRLYTSKLNLALLWRVRASGSAGCKSISTGAFSGALNM